MKCSILEEVERGIAFSADDIKATALDDRPTVASAIFPLEQYTGTITTDLFADDETSYFDNWEEFLRLQKEAVTQLVKHHEATAASVELTEAYRIPDWQYDEAEEEQGGVLINLSPTGRVDIRDGLCKARDRPAHGGGNRRASLKGGSQIRGPVISTFKTGTTAPEAVVSVVAIVGASSTHIGRSLYPTTMAGHAPNRTKRRCPGALAMGRAEIFLLADHCPVTLEDRPQVTLA
jgi:hypothetical protein